MTYPKSRFFTGPQRSCVRWQGQGLFAFTEGCSLAVRVFACPIGSGLTPVSVAWSPDIRGFWRWTQLGECVSARHGEICGGVGDRPFPSVQFLGSAVCIALFPSCVFPSFGFPSTCPITWNHWFRVLKPSSQGNRRCSHLGCCLCHQSSLTSLGFSSASL